MKTKTFETDDIKVIIEDVKGRKLDVYKIKRKIFLKKYVIDNDIMEFRET